MFTCRKDCCNRSLYLDYAADLLTHVSTRRGAQYSGSLAILTDSAGQRSDTRGVRFRRTGIPGRRTLSPLLRTCRGGSNQGPQALSPAPQSPSPPLRHPIQASRHQHSTGPPARDVRHREQAVLSHGTRPAFSLSPRRTVAAQGDNLVVKRYQHVGQKGALSDKYLCLGLFMPTSAPHPLVLISTGRLGPRRFSGPLPPWRWLL